MIGPEAVTELKKTCRTAACASLNALQHEVSMVLTHLRKLLTAFIEMLKIGGLL